MISKRIFGQLSFTDKLGLTGLIITFLCFIAYKLTFIDVPYFWDESWVYGPAVSEMGQRLPSLLPGSISIDLSRGHPMLFHFLGGIWGNIFGGSIRSLHIFAFVLSCILLFTLTKITLKESNLLFGIFATILLIVQGLFLAQSAMVLPEVLVSLFGLLSIYAWSREKWFQGAIWASACLLTKESGAMLMLALGISYLAHHLLLSRFELKNSIKILFLLFFACLPYILFLIIQHHRFGWFLYPNHLDLQIKSAEAFQGQLKSAIGTILYYQNRIALTVLVFIIISVNNYKSRHYWAWLLYFCANLFVIFAMPWKRWSSFAIYSGLALSSLILMISYYKSYYKKSHFLYLNIGIFSIIYLGFTAYNFFSARYVLILLPLYILCCTKIISIYKSTKWTIVAIIIAIFFMLSAGLRRTPTSDTTQSFINAGQAQKEMFLYLENNNHYNDIILAPFLIQEALKKPFAGYRNSNIPFTNVVYSPEPNKAFLSISSSIEGEYINQVHKQDRESRILAEFQRGNIWFKIELFEEMKQGSENME